MSDTEQDAEPIILRRVGEFLPVQKPKKRGSVFDIFSMGPKRTVPDIPPLLRPLRGHRRRDRNLWSLEGAYTYFYEESGEFIRVPHRFVTDLASIPAALRVRYNPANFAEAALVHDWLYAIGERGKREKCDRVFHQLLIETENTKHAGEMYNGVRIGGGKGYGLDEDYAFWDAEKDAIETPDLKVPTGFLMKVEDSDIL